MPNQQTPVSNKATGTILFIYGILGVIAYYLLQYALTCESFLPKFFVGILAFGLLYHALPFVIGFGILYFMFQLAMGIIQH